jgi:16S rRNA (guanine527-N7)-methyltransferase
MEKHFLDSLALQPVLARQPGSPSSLLDVGTGAGFPGLVLAAVMPELQVTLVEPRQKRVSFLMHIVRTLQLTNVEIIAARLDQADLGRREFTFITSRAVADISGFTALLEDIPGPDSLVLIMQASENMQCWARSSVGQSWQLVAENSFQLPFSGASRQISLIRKRYSVV